MSLKYKLLTLIILLLTVTLAVFLFTATGLFTQDKVAYVFESSASHARALATTFEMETERAHLASSLLRTPSPEAQNILNQNESIRGVVVFHFAPQRLDVTVKNFKTDVLSISENEIQKRLLSLLTYHQMSRYDFYPVREATGPNAQKNLFWYSEVQTQNMQRPPMPSRLIPTPQNSAVSAVPAVTVVSLLLRSDNLGKALDEGGVFSDFIAGPNGEVLLSSADTDPNSLQEPLRYIRSSQNQIQEGATELKQDDGSTVIASFNKIEGGPFVAASIIEKSAALKAVRILFVKSVLFFIILISSSVILSIFAANWLTKKLTVLSEATNKVAEGNFDIQVEVKGKDEVAQLAMGFNTMAGEVSRLLKENVHKARMEKELETAKLVQSTLFPAPEASIGATHVSGFYQPATECGGDWWYYFGNAKQLFICVGDATGHGAPAALVTSAARSAISLIEGGTNLSPKYILTLLNRAIYASSKGQIQMTFFAACIDPLEKTVTYVNASHEPAFLIRAGVSPVKRKDLVALIGENNPRLGEALSVNFVESTESIGFGDRLLIYTDGLTGLLNNEKVPWQEKGFFKALTESLNVSKSELPQLIHRMNDFKKEAELVDDVTCVLCSVG